MNLKNAQAKPEFFEAEDDDWNTSKSKKKSDNIKVNTFRYETFTERLKKIKVRLSTQYENENCYLEMKTDENFSYGDEGNNTFINDNRI